MGKLVVMLVWLQEKNKTVQKASTLEGAVVFFIGVQIFELIAIGSWFRRQSTNQPAELQGGKQNIYARKI